MSENTETTQARTETRIPLADLPVMMEPWMKAGRIWTEEADKLRRTAMEHMEGALEETHKLARQNLTMVATVGAAVHKELTGRMERGYELMSSLVR